MTEIRNLNKRKAKRICFALLKGGVGKTTICANVGYALAQMGKKVLLIDFDSQASLCQMTGLDVTDDEIRTIDELINFEIENRRHRLTYREVEPFIYRPTYQKRQRKENSIEWETVEEPFGFDLIGSCLNLSLAELNMSLNGGGRNIYPGYLEDILDAVEGVNDIEEVGGDYDYILIDTPPALSSLSVNAMFCSTSGVVICSNMDLLAFKGIQAYIDKANQVVEIKQAKGEEHRGILGVCLSAFSQRRTVDNYLKSYIQTVYPVPCFTHQIRESSDARKATASLLLFSQINKKAEVDFKELAEEIDFAINHPEEWREQAREMAAANGVDVEAIDKELETEGSEE